MQKLNLNEYILKAAQLYGLTYAEIKALEKHLNGKVPNDFIVRRCQPLFRLYSIYNSEKYNEYIDPDENGIINLNDYAFEISKRRLADSKIGKFWLISSNLDSYLATIPANMSSEILPQYLNISEKNNFLIPQLARQIGIDATIYYKGENSNHIEGYKEFHFTKNFIHDKETLIRGSAFIKDKQDKLMLDFNNILEETDKYVKRHYRKYKLPQEELENTRREIREGLIKQTLFNKIVFNENESNEKWGLIIGEDNRLRLAPLFSYDFCANVQTINKTQHRVVRKNKEYIEDMERITGVTLTDQEKDYYNFSIMEKMHSKIVNVSDLNYNEQLVVQEKKKNLTMRDRFNRVRKIMHDKKVDMSYLVKRVTKGNKDDNER